MPSESTITKPDGWTPASEGYVKVTRLDYFGQPYEAWELPRRPSYTELWDRVRKTMFSYNPGPGNSLRLPTDRETEAEIFKQLNPE